METKTYFSTKEAASYLMLSTRTLQNLRDQKRIAFAMLGRKIYYTKDDLDSYVAKGRINSR